MATFDFDLWWWNDLTSDQRGDLARFGPGQTLPAWAAVSLIEARHPTATTWLPIGAGTQFACPPDVAESIANDNEDLRARLDELVQLEADDGSLSPSDAQDLTEVQHEMQERRF